MSKISDTTNKITELKKDIADTKVNLFYKNNPPFSLLVRFGRVIFGLR